MWKTTGVAALILPLVLTAQTGRQPTAKSPQQSKTGIATTQLSQNRQKLGPGVRDPGADDNPEAKPPMTKTDIQIVQQAKKILDSPAKWNRKDNRKCPADEKTFSLYCALEEATRQVTGDFKHRGAAMQEARFVIDDIAPNHSKYDHRLMDYNNDPTTTWADVQKFFKLLEARIAKRLGEQGKQ